MKTLWQRYSRDLAALVALAVLALAYFWRPLLSRGVWVPQGGGDLASFLYPMFVFAARNLAAGHVPLWNPNLHAGMPFAADLQSGLFYPLNWPAFARGAGFGYRDLEAVVLVHYPLAGAFTYLFARDLGLRRAAAWLAAATFMLSGFLVTHLGHGNMVQSAAWLPLELLLTRRMVTRCSPRYAAATAAALALSFLAAHLQMVLYQGATVLAYALCQPAPTPWGRRVALLGMVAAVGCGATALKLVPGAELTGYSVRSGLPFERAAEFAAQPIGLVTLLLPHVWGTNPTNYWGPWSNTEVLGYVGVLPLVLAACALIARRTFQPLFFLGLALFALLLSLGDATVLFGWVYRFVPGFGMVRAAGRSLYLFDFGIALAAGFGLDALSSLVARSLGPRTDDERALGWLARAVGAGLLAVVGFGLPLFLVEQVMSPVLVPRAITAISDLFFLAVYLAAALLLLAGALRRWLSPTSLAVLALGVTILDIASAYHDFNPTTQDPLVGYQHDELVARIRQDADAALFRVDSETDAIASWQPDAANLYGLHDAGGLFNPLGLARYERFRATVGRQYGSPAYDLLNVRYLIAPAAQDVEQRLLGDTARGDFELVGRFDDGLALYRQRGTLPRARVLYAAEAVSGPEEAFERLGRPPATALRDPTRVALIEGPAIDNQAPPPPSEARIVTYLADNVAIVADAQADGYLVLADAVYPGWRASVDGESVPIYGAYGAFRAVRLAPGHDEVRFEFLPTTWAVGWPISALTWVGLAGWGGLALLRKVLRPRVPDQRGLAAHAAPHPAVTARAGTSPTDQPQVSGSAPTGGASARE